METNYMFMFFDFMIKNWFGVLFVIPFIISLSGTMFKLTTQQFGDRFTRVRSAENLEEREIVTWADLVYLICRSFIPLLNVVSASIYVSIAIKATATSINAFLAKPIRKD